MDRPVKNLNPLLRIAVIAGVDSAVKLHIQRGDNLDGRDRKGMTPLMLAAARKRKGIVRLLLAAGANPALHDSKGQDALAYAEKGGCPTCLSLLREAQGDLVTTKEIEPGISKHCLMALEKEQPSLKGLVFFASKQDVKLLGHARRFLKTEPPIEIEKPLDIFDHNNASEGRREVASETDATEGDCDEGKGTRIPKAQSGDREKYLKKNEHKAVTAKLSSMTRVIMSKEQESLIESISSGADKFRIKDNHLPAENESAIGTHESQDIVTLGDDLLDFDSDSDWEAEQEAAAPVGDGTVAEQARLLHEEIGRHKIIDTDEEWNDIHLFLPGRAIPLARYDSTSGSVSELLFIALREGSVPAHALVNACLSKDGSRDEEAERRLSFVLGDLGALIESENATDKLPFLGAPTVDEEYELAEAFEFADDLASGWNVPMRFYIKELKKKLLTAEEEIKLARIMEESTADALKALSSWPTGLAVLFDAADQVERGEADVEMFSTGPEPSDEDEIGGEWADADEGDLELEPAAIFFISAVSEARSAGDDLRKVHESILSAGLSRGFLIEIAEKLKDDISAEAFVSAIQRQVVAREKMILSNLRLVISVARKFSWSKQPFDDLVQEGNIGLMKAVERFDWRRGFRFSTYATWWIRQQISRSIANNERVVRAPVHTQAAARNLLRKRDEIVAETGHSVTEQELSLRERMSLDKVKLLLSVFEDVASLDEVEEVKKLPVIDSLPCLEKYYPEFIAELTSLRTALLETLEELDERSAQVITMRFGLGGADPLTLEEVGLYFDVTRERIRQIESQALRKLSHPNRAEKLSASLSQIGPPFFSEY